MSYTAWSVVFGEQPSASKWNILGTNDASFNDGTGIADSAILTRHLAANNVTAAKIASGAVLLGYGKASANQTDITTTETDLNGLTATVTVPTGGRDLLLMFNIPLGSSSGATEDQIRFFFKEGTTYLASTSYGFGSGFGTTLTGCAIIEDATAGSHTYKVSVKRVNGSGSFATNYTTASPDISIPSFYVFGL